MLGHKLQGSSKSAATIEALVERGVRSARSIAATLKDIDEEADDRVEAVLGSLA